MKTLDDYLLDENLSYNEIAKIFEVAKSTIYKRAKEKGIIRKVGRKKLNLDGKYESKIYKR